MELEGHPAHPLPKESQLHPCSSGYLFIKPILEYLYNPSGNLVQVFIFSVITK